VLNAKQHKAESEIVAEAGRAGAVTIATNMAGRGTDIKLGEGVVEPRTVGWARERGIDLEELVPVDPTQEVEFESKPDDFVIQAGGLQILGSERHESRRIDRQLRGRSGRQGDPGATQFFISVEDDLMRLFVGDRLANAMDRLGASEGEVITHPMVTRAIETAQKRVEGNNFESRKRLLDYDDVMNQQREVIYDRRLFALEGGEDLKGEMWEMIEHKVQSTVDEYLESEHEEEWDLPGLKRRITLDYFTSLKGLPDETDENHELEVHQIHQMAVDAVHEQFHRKIDGFGEHAEGVTSYIMLSVIDGKWKDHLYDLDHLKASIGFRGWGQKDPLVEYKKEAYEMFVDLMDDLRGTVGNLLFKAQLGQPREAPRQPQRIQYSGPTEDGAGSGALAQAAAAARTRQPAGSGGSVDDLGMAQSTQSGGAGRGRTAPLGSVGGVPSPQDPRELATNRGEGERVREPVTATKEPGRNEACPCGSGKKYKKCHGRGA
jgi:preprotein translocase subunit SecA